MCLELNEEQFSESKYSTFEKLDDNFALFMMKYFNGNKYLAVSLETNFHHTRYINTLARLLAFAPFNF